MKEGKTTQGSDLIDIVKRVISLDWLGIRVHNLGYVPRWVILLIDTLIVLFTALLTYWLIDGIGQSYVPQNFTFLALGLYVFFNVISFRIFRVYAGIIRHSSYIDAIKIFFSQISWFMLSLFVNGIFTVVFKVDKLFLTTGLLINFVFSFSALFVYRILIKKIFDNYLTESKNRHLIKALIYGTDANAISVANALLSEVPARFKILGFLDKKSTNTSKRILDLPIILHYKKVPVHLRANGAEALIIADKALSKDEKMSIVDSCLEFNFKIYTVPLISDWEDSKEISKKVKNFQIQDLLERKPIVLDDDSISDQLKDKVVLITGAAGSIGSEIVWQVINFNPKQIIMIDQAESPLHQLRLELDKMKFSTIVSPIIADVRNQLMMEQIFEKFTPHVVYHAAAYKHVPLMEENPSQAILTNVLGTKIVADLADKYKSDKFVMVSTDKAVNPSNVMGASKRIAEKYVQSLHNKLQKENKEIYTKYITTRFGNVLGSNGSVVPLFTKQIEEGGPITITHPDIIRYFMTIPEACQLVLEAGSMGKGGEIYIFDMGKPVKIIDLAQKMIKLAGFVPEKDIKIKTIGLRPGEKLYEELLNDSAKTLPTHHEKIMIAQEPCEEFEITGVEIDSLISKAQTFDKEGVVVQMKKIVPEFLSMNSEFEALDIKH